tara:strand:- start:1375 stop:3009 length:1635 start_codon:yes stop_codon:yes gene_type:complete
MPKIEPKKGLKRTRRRKAWGGLDDILGESTDKQDNGPVKDKPTEASLRASETTPTKYTQPNRNATDTPATPSKTTVNNSAVRADENINSNTTVTPKKQSDNSKETEKKHNSNTTATSKEHKSNRTATLSEQLSNTKGTEEKQNSNTAATEKKQKDNAIATVREQKGNAKVTIDEHSNNDKGTVRQHQDNKAGTQEEQLQKRIRNTDDTVRQQSSNLNSNSYSNVTVTESEVFEGTDSQYVYEKLRFIMGTKREIIIYLVERAIDLNIPCIKNTTYNELASVLNKKKNSLKTIAKRLKYDDRLIDIRAIGKGIGTRIDIFLHPDLISQYRSLVKEGLIDIEAEKSNTTVTKLATKLATTSPSSSSNNNITTTTNNTKKQNLKNMELPTEWLNIDIPDNVRDVGFTAHHIKQLYRDCDWSAEELTGFIEGFSYDLAKGKHQKTRNGALSLFMGILIKGNPYNSEDYLKELRAKRDEEKRKFEEFQEIKKQMAQKDLEKKFEKFKLSLSQDEIDELVPPNEFYSSGSDMQILMLKEKYQKGELEGST